MEIYSPNPNRKSSNYDSMVEQITPNMNIIIHNKTKTPLDKFNRSSNGNMAKACHLDTIHFPTIIGFEGLRLKNYMLKFEPFIKLTSFFIILSCTHYF